ncbi:hypothetical protein CGRA01v4_13173 [Colletotrichum graminicola]|uniref:Uncharacterized protein n=1 Tax=Colletotrichum graminicola (strain M1.001 / M2 / FGSC 10212) TaxID=645133 RepID=E3QMA2_COLGM|nr:uncharacterized protein GLRG_07134 [Colletotrichum graminicola M1.001]EFQ31990.1 hypothetical protein GLRG_07134 [Colletotrichum graminicola M1.001]WDK21883.1 hypothetical protein CGRA01v4_13173 [Colletotrichum graminicola]
MSVRDAAASMRTIVYGADVVYSCYLAGTGSVLGDMRFGFGNAAAAVGSNGDERFVLCADRGRRARHARSPGPG